MPKILIVDDVPSNIKVLIQALKNPESWLPQTDQMLLLLLFLNGLTLFCWTL